jgi:alkylation response protein AidB-like acyl-CoA dehydrogenase
VKTYAATGPHDAATRDRVMRLWVRAEVLRLTNIRASQNRSQGTPGPEGSIGKLAMADVHKDISACAVDLLGAEGTLFPTGYPMARPQTTALWSNAQQAFLRSRANSIEGGTTEIMKNILGERVLGLPGDVRTDKDLPWNEVPRS